MHAITLVENNFLKDGKSNSSSRKRLSSNWAFSIIHCFVPLEYLKACFPYFFYLSFNHLVSPIIHYFLLFLQTPVRMMFPIAKVALLASFTILVSSTLTLYTT
jgi:hypothetical protein